MKRIVPSSIAASLPSSGSKAAARQQREGRRRLERLTRFYALQHLHGLSRIAAMRAMRMSTRTIWSWEKRLRAANGFAGLISRRKGPAHSPAVQIGLRPEILQRAQRLAVLKGSVAAGWRALAMDASCPAELRSALAPGRHIPDALQAAISLSRRTITVRFAVLRAGQFAHRHELRDGKRRTA